MVSAVTCGRPIQGAANSRPEGYEHQNAQARDLVDKPADHFQTRTSRPNGRPQRSSESGGLAREGLDLADQRVDRLRRRCCGASSSAG